MVLFSQFFINIENYDGIIISGTFKRYFKPELRPILSIFFMFLALYESQARNVVLYCWDILLNIFLAKSFTVSLSRGNTCISAFTKYVYSVIVCHQLNINLSELHHRVSFLHISLVIHSAWGWLAMGYANDASLQYSKSSEGYFLIWAKICIWVCSNSLFKWFFKLFPCIFN